MVWKLWPDLTGDGYQDGYDRHRGNQTETLERLEHHIDQQIMKQIASMLITSDRLHSINLYCISDLYNKCTKCTTITTQLYVIVYVI